MGKRLFCCLLAAGLLFLSAACGNRNLNTGEATSAHHSEIGVSASSQDTIEVQAPEAGGIPIVLVVGTQSFSAVLDGGAAADALAQRFPLTLEMEDLNANEKFFYFEDFLASDSKAVGEIKAGDIMLYGTDCLVLFYDSFSTPFHYTRLGQADHPEGLAAALGQGRVTVTFQREK